MNKLAADSYVQISREEFEEWLNKTEFHGKWSVRSGTVGVYQLRLSDNVAIEISSSIGSRDEAMGHGRASIQMRLSSIVTGHTLNKVAQGQSHFKRTTNWRDTLKKAIDKFRDVYVKSVSFYEAVAVIKDRDQYKKDWLAKIESNALWKNNALLSNYHQKITQGSVLTQNQIDTLEKFINTEQKAEKETGQAAPETQVDEDYLNKIRKLYILAKQSGNTWMTEFAESVGKQYKARGFLSAKQRSILDKSLQQYKISSIAAEMAKVAKLIIR